MQWENGTEHRAAGTLNGNNFRALILFNAGCSKHVTVNSIKKMNELVIVNLMKRLPLPILADPN